MRGRVTANFIIICFSLTYILGKYSETFVSTHSEGRTGRSSPQAGLTLHTYVRFWLSCLEDSLCKRIHYSYSVSVDTRYKNWKIYLLYVQFLF
jgi:hypothetical protein